MTDATWTFVDFHWENNQAKCRDCGRIFSPIVIKEIVSHECHKVVSDKPVEEEKSGHTPRGEE